MELILKAGARLMRKDWEYDSEARQGEWVETDVTDRAHQFLFETVKLEDGVTLDDVFKLLDADPILVAVLRRDFSEELLAEARKGVSPKFVPGYSPQGIEYLELYQVWSFNTATREYAPMHRLDFHGIGYELREDLDEGGGCVYKKGARIQWGISCSPVREMLSLPLRIREDIPVCEDDLDARAWGNTLETVKLAGVSLGQVLHGVLWELSFHGGPQEAEAFADTLKARADEVRELRQADAEEGGLGQDEEGAPAGQEAPSAKLCSLEELFGDMDRPGCALMFETMGDNSPYAVSSALRTLDDDCIIAQGVQELFGPAVRVKPEFAALPAREFRKRLREANSEEHKS